MELKRKQIERLEQVLTREEVLEVSTESIIPDSCSDVIRIAVSSANVIIKEKNVSADRITLGGMCAVKLLCITEKCQNGETINVSIPLSHVISDSVIDTDCKVIFDANVIECNTILTNSRKVSVKVRVMLETKICKYKNLWLTTDIPEMDNTYCLKKDFHDEYIACIEEKQLRLVENISIDTDEIEPLRWSVDFITEDVKNIKEKAMVRGNCQLRVLFINKANGELRREKYHLPFSAVIENSKFANVENIEVDYVCSYTDVSVNSTTAGYTLNCDIITSICVTGKNQICEQIAADIFNSRYELETKWEKLNGVMKISRENIRKQISLDFEKIDNADKVFDFNYLINHRTAGRTVYVSINLYVIYKDAVGEIYGVLCKHDIEYEMPDNFFDIKINAENVSIQCNNNNGIHLDAELVFDVSFGNVIETEQLSSCTILKDSLKTKKGNASLVLRKVAAGETMWDIAKRYNTSPDAIAQANKFEDDVHNISGRLIMIPIVK